MSVFWLAVGMLALVPFLIVQQLRIAALRRSRRDSADNDDCHRFAQELIEAIPCPVFYKSLEGRYLGCNGAFAEYLGRPREQIIGRTVYDVAPQELADRYAAADAALFARAGTQVYDVQVRRADGSVRDVVMHKAAFAGVGSALPGVIGVITDITERKRAEQALRASEREFRTLAENLPDILVRYDREGRRTYVNPALQQSLAVTAAEVIGKTLPETNPAGLALDVYQRALEHTLATGERSEFELPITRPDGGRETHLCILAAERAADGRVSGAIAISRDITERKRNEAELERYRHELEQRVEDRTQALSIAKETAEAATRAKSRFLAAASHDLRQPLQAIRLFVDALLATGLDERQRNICRLLSRSTNSLGELLGRLLDISRLDAGTIVPQRAVIEAEELLGTVGAEFDALASENGLSLDLYCPRRPLALFSDRDLLLTILRNLVGNALKYTKQGGILLAIRRRHGRALIQVWDTGVGIAPEQRDQIFEDYFQVGNPERDLAKGVGLGLAIVKRLSELLGGQVRCRSRLGRGSLFEVSLPLAADPGEVPAPAALAGEDVAGRFAGKRVVVVEDDAMAGEAIRLCLETNGVRVALFRTAEDALGSAAAMGADYYISDYRLPGMDGLQMLGALQGRSAARLKAVMLTGNTPPEQVAIGQASGWKVLFKPVDVPQLLSALEALETA